MRSLMLGTFSLDMLQDQWKGRQVLTGAVQRMELIEKSIRVPDVSWWKDH